MKINYIKYEINNYDLKDEESNKKEKENKDKDNLDNINDNNNIIFLVDNKNKDENKIQNKKIKKGKKDIKNKVFKRLKEINIDEDNTIVNNYDINDNILENNNKIKNKRNKNNKEKNELLSESISKLKQNKNKIEKNEKIFETIDEEINNISYELAIENDHRSYCAYYLSLLRTKHKLIFAFYNNRDYNSQIIKIDLFFIILASNYTINALFYNDDTMHNIYEKEGTFDIAYEFPKIAYSFIISLVLEMIVKQLALSNKAIIAFKNDKNKQTVDKRALKLHKLLAIKFLFYFIISFIFLGFFWYYISMFGAVYPNTQLYLLKDTLISFGLSLVYPFGINLLPGLFRITALADRRNKRKCLYTISKIIQYFN